jgi:hypothetical protein
MPTMRNGHDNFLSFTTTTRLCEAALSGVSDVYAIERTLNEPW